MKRRILKPVLALFVSLLVLGGLTACGNQDKPADGGKAKVKVAVVCDSAGKNDNGYNQSAVAGLEKAGAEFGIETKVVEPTTGVPQALEALADDGYNLIFNLEYDFEALIKGTGGAKPLAEQYPDTTFVVFNDNPNVDESGNLIHKNVISCLFDVNQSSYVAGALSVLVNENAQELFGDGYNFTSVDDGGRSIGFIGGTNSNGITVFSYGFIEGINHMADKLGVDYDYYAKYDAGFSDSATGSSIAGTFYNQGANVVFSVAGNVGDGAAAKAKEAGKLAIHVDANKDAQQPGYILTSVIKNTEVPVYDITKALCDGKIADMPNTQTFSLASGATSITDLKTIEEHVVDSGKPKFEEIKSEVKEIEGQINDGTIKVIDAQAGDTFDPATCPHVVIK